MILGLNKNLVESLHFPQALKGLLPGTRSREQARKDDVYYLIQERNQIITSNDNLNMHTTKIA
jgi:hypothetical protein